MESICKKQESDEAVTSDENWAAGRRRASVVLFPITCEEADVLPDERR